MSRASRIKSSRRRRAALLGGLSLALITCPSSHAGPQEVWGYYPSWLQDDWQALDWSAYHRLIYFSFDVGKDGRLIGAPGADDGADAFFGACEWHAKPCDMAIGLFNVEVFNAVFADEAKRAELRADLLRLLSDARIQGVHLDIEIFERPSSAAVRGVNRFVQTLARQFEHGPVPRQLSAFLVIGADTVIYEPATLALFERVVVQGYDAHWPEGERAGPLAPLKGPDELTWVKVLDTVRRRGIVRERIVFSVPYYGYEWQTEDARPRAKALTSAQELAYALSDPVRLPALADSAMEKVAEHGSRRDPQSGSPYYSYRDANGAIFQGWYEDDASLREKYGFVQREGLAGVAVFPVRYDAGRLDPLLKQFFGADPKTASHR